MEVSRVCRLVEGKGHDRTFVANLPRSVDTYLLAVADGLTSENGGAASQWVVDALDSIVRNSESGSLTARTVFDALSQALHRDQIRGGLAESHTTLTCGIISAVESSEHLRFDFFAVGDSPVWKIVPARGEGLKFQAFMVYTGPVPGHQSHVYATVNLGAGSVDGSVYFGAVEVGPGESLLLASDGIPDTRIIWDDQDPKHNKKSPQLGLRLLDPKPLGDNVLAGLLKAYDKRGLLIDDDASLIVVRALVNRQADSEIDPRASEAADGAVACAIASPTAGSEQQEQITSEIAMFWFSVNMRGRFSPKGRKIPPFGRGFSRHEDLSVRFVCCGCSGRR
jgi:hypothetical protein